MKITGIICEYNPLHNGHARQLDTLRRLQGEDSGIVCMMSGNFVQRGEPAVFDKLARAEAAVRCGADLVLELPITCALSSAEGFAAGGVSILAPFCDHLCFGAENANQDALLDTARALLSPEFPEALRSQLDKGLSFPAARQQALQHMGLDTSLLTDPNNILAVEYCKAILSQNPAMQPLPIHRPGSYHDTAADLENPSATALRVRLSEGLSLSGFVPEAALEVFQNAKVHTLRAGQRAMLARLRTMSDSDFESVPFGSEGLWRKLMHAVRAKSGLSEIIDTVKSKRYTYTRISRMVLCAFLGLTDTDLTQKPPYVRVLALNDRGREILNKARQTGIFINAGEAVDSPYFRLEQRAADLYGLFAEGEPESAGAEKKYRVFYQKTEEASS